MKVDLSEVTRGEAWDRVARGYTDFISAHLERYAADALRIAALEPRERVLDVATGPGTLARLAARTHEVTALDHSAEMIDALRERASGDELSRLTLTVGDGQALPYADASFDAAFSMFGLFMFPDRAKGFAELRRVLDEGGRAVVGPWQSSQSELPAFRLVREELTRGIEPPPPSGMPLSDPEELRSEMSAAGFTVDVTGVSHTLEVPSTIELWRGLERSHVAIVIAKHQLSAVEYEALTTRLAERLVEELGEGPQSLTMEAWLALGR
jgi:ubiquinone/menaquinone biosynthesis C-methylase UbiE